MQLPDQSNEFPNQQDLQALAALRSDQGPAFSLYLDLRPEKGDPMVRLERLILQVLKQKKLDQAPPANQRAWEKESGRLRQALEQAPQAQGLAVFSSIASGFWRV